MNVFESNLAKFCEDMQESEEHVAQLADISMQELDLLKDNSVSRVLLAKFCVNTGVNLSSVYSRTGFEAKTIEEQYSDYPTFLKKVISRLFCKSLIKSYCENSEAQFKIFLKVTRIGSQIISRVISGSSCFSPADFEEVFSGMSQVIPRSECKILLAKCMYSLIPNWNFLQLHKYFKVGYAKIASYLGLSPSAISNWGSIGAVPLSESYYEKLASCFGFDKFEFSTIALTAADYAGKSCKLVSEPITSNEVNDIFFADRTDFIDPPTDEPVEPIAELIKLPAKTRKSRRSKASPRKQTKPKSRQAAPSDEVNNNQTVSVTPVINVTEETAKKMYSKLSDVHKAEVISLISNLFLSEL